MWQLEYSYDGVPIGDLFPISSGFTSKIERNGVGFINFSVSLRKLKQFCDDLQFDITRMFTPLKSSIRMIDRDGTSKTMGGFLAATPQFSFGSSADATVAFTFVGWLGFTAGGYMIPPFSYNANFDYVAQRAIELMVERSYIAGAIWPISASPSLNVLPVVSGTLDAPKTLKDFLLERADNTEGTGTFDVYADPDGVISLYEKYGFDISADNTFVYPDDGTKYGLKGIDFPQWDRYISDMFLTGAGNGYSSTSGEEGAAIFSEARNTDTIANTGYWQYASSESDISDQTTLDAKATSYVKDTDKPFSTPNIKLDGDNFKVYDHDQGGDLWLGDVITVNTTGWVDGLLPLETPLTLRINNVDMTIDKTGHCDLSLGMMADG